MLFLGCKQDDTNACGCGSPIVRELTGQTGQLFMGPDQALTIVPAGVDAPAFFVCNTGFSSLGPIIDNMKNTGTQQSDTILFSGQLKKVCPQSLKGSFPSTPYHVELTSIRPK